MCCNSSMRSNQAKRVLSDWCASVQSSCCVSGVTCWFVCSSPRAGWKSDEDNKKGKGCMLQFQHAMVRVLTHFVAEQADPREPQAFFLGSDWQVDVTRLVRYFMKVEDPRVARLQAGRVLSGRDLGTTNIQVMTVELPVTVQHKLCPSCGWSTFKPAPRFRHI